MEWIHERAGGRRRLIGEPYRGPSRLKAFSACVFCMHCLHASKGGETPCGPALDFSLKVTTLAIFLFNIVRELTIELKHVPTGKRIEWHSRHPKNAHSLSYSMLAPKSLCYSLIFLIYWVFSSKYVKYNCSRHHRHERAMYGHIWTRCYRTECQPIFQYVSIVQGRMSNDAPQH